MRRLVLAAISVACLAGIGGETQASTVGFRFLANCGSNCASVGLPQDGTIYGTLTVSAANFSQLGPLGPSDLVDFSITFGSNTLTKATSASTNFYGVWSKGIFELTTFTLIAAKSLSPATGPGINLFGTGGFVSATASCATAPLCETIDMSSIATVSNLSLELAPGPLPTVPLPAGIWFGLSAVGALALAGRRRRVSLR